jgi:hypothetical protein
MHAIIFLHVDCRPMVALIPRQVVGVLGAGSAARNSAGCTLILLRVHALQALVTVIQQRAARARRDLCRQSTVPAATIRTATLVGLLEN